MGRTGVARGQALVEFALVLPVLMLILMGIVQLGFLFGAQIGLTNAVREAARFGSLSPTTSSAQATTNATAVQTYMTGTVLPQNVPGYSSANLTSSSVTYCKYLNPGSGSTSYSVRITINVRYAHPMFIPLVGVILDPFDGVNDNALRITSIESFRVENVPLNATEVSTLSGC